MDSSLQLIAIALFFSLIFLCNGGLRGKKSSKFSKSREAPEPSGAWPIIGHLHLLGGADKLLHQTLGLMADKYGPAFNIRIGSHCAFVVASSELAKECFTINDKDVASRPTTAATKHMCYNHAVFGFAPHSSHWREMRKIVMLELLSNRRLEMVKHVQNSEVNLGIKKLYHLWAENNCLPVLVELKQWFEDLTLNVIVRVVAGKRYTGSSDDDGARRCQNAISKFFHLMGIFVVSDALPFLQWLDLEGHQRAMKKTAKDLDAVLEGWLTEHRQKRVSVLGEAKTEGEQDFIDVMLSLEEKGHLSGFIYDADTSIKSTCLALIAGASDTTTTTLTWAISLLLNNKSALKKAREELDLHVGPERQVDESDLKSLVYIQAIIKETLRLYPVAPLIPREFTKDCTIAGYHVPAGTRLLVNAWKIQRDPRYWTNPSAFQPERFLTSHANVDVRGQHHELIPFGSGRRSCPGAAFALHALHLTLARFLHAFDLATTMDKPVDMTETPGTTLPKATPLDVLLSPRLPAELYSC
ncbi:xanthotoxin 5-hydroxylase CYP82C4 [Jatropha curcas]|nr:xanthotoxin 5-hydroxylase CYP82C4 [Jatropha curcas]